jgi:signal transduction histidine kinase
MKSTPLWPWIFIGTSTEPQQFCPGRHYRVDTARERTHGGSGIGLAIAKALMQAHHGQITATSPGTGQGATFRILLPRG